MISIQIHFLITVYQKSELSLRKSKNYVVQESISNLSNETSKSQNSNFVSKIALILLGNCLIIYLKTKISERGS